MKRPVRFVSRRSKFGLGDASDDFAQLATEVHAVNQNYADAKQAGDVVGQRDALSQLQIMIPQLRALAAAAYGQDVPANILAQLQAFDDGLAKAAADLGQAATVGFSGLLKNLGMLPMILGGALVVYLVIMSGGARRSSS